MYSKILSTIISNHWDSKGSLEVEVEVEGLSNTIFSLVYSFIYLGVRGSLLQRFVLECQCILRFVVSYYKVPG